MIGTHIVHKVDKVLDALADRYLLCRFSEMISRKINTMLEESAGLLMRREPVISLLRNLTTKTATAKKRSTHPRISKSK